MLDRPPGAKEAQRAFVKLPKYWLLFGALAWCIGPGCVPTSMSHSTNPMHASEECRELGRSESHRLLLDRSQIRAVELLKQEPFVVRPSPLKLAHAKQRAKVIGARITLRPAAGVTAERLQWLADCDQLAAIQPGGEQVLHCPFELDNSSVKVISTGDGFAIDIVSTVPSTSNEIVRRSKNLVP
jgi:hypothetical protein